MNFLLHWNGKHPIDGYNKMHSGHTAPIGTIMASGDGIIKKAGWCGGGKLCENKT